MPHNPAIYAAPVVAAFAVCVAVACWRVTSVVHYSEACPSFGDGDYTQGEIESLIRNSQCWEGV